LLDIFGFENFAKNSFEQLCINLANEQLQLYFNEHVFKLELEEYQKEGLGAMDIKYEDNRPVLEMFTRKPISLFVLLNEESKLQSSSTKSLVQKLSSHLGKEPAFKGSGFGFTIAHYAGAVVYEASGMIEKNRDTLLDDISALLASSKVGLVKQLFGGGGAGASKGGPPPAAGNRGGAAVKSKRGFSVRNLFKSRRSKKGPQVKTVPGAGNPRKGGAAAKITVATKFQASLTLLVSKMTPCNPHFVRCIKPNHTASPASWETEYVLGQLKYTGTVRVFFKQNFALEDAIGSHACSLEVQACV
jgi:myosin-3